MTLELFLAVLCVLLAGVTVKTLVLYASMGIQVDRAQQRATNALVAVDDLNTRITQLEADVYEDEGEDDDYEAPALTPYGEMPGLKGAQRGE